VRAFAVAAVVGAVVACGAALAGCGSSSGPPRATLVLDFTPNAVHAGIYSAVARGFDRARGVAITIREPSSSTDSVKLLLSGRADFAVLDIHDLAIARAAGRDVVGVLALEQRPLAAVLAQPNVPRPRALVGRRAGVTGLPSDNAVLRSVVAGDGGDPARVRTITIGFDAVPTLLARKVDAATAFWDVEGVALKRARPGIREFRVDEFGAPAYPELVLCVSRATLTHRRALVRNVVAALVRGYGVTVAKPTLSATDLLGRVPSLDPAAVMSQLSALRGTFTAGAAYFGQLDRTRLSSWAAWEARFGIVARPPDVARMFDPSLAAAAAGR
jgi:ABC-type nitrate/sulfonate/bicarbonate transport system substrate-binding protein